MTEIKICGLFRPEDIEAVNVARPDYAGFVVDFPASHRSVTPAQLRELRARLLPTIRAIGVFVDQPIERLEAFAAEGLVDGFQLHGHESDEEIVRLQRTGLPVWRAFRVREKADLAAAASPADMVLLDNGAGTGQPFDWSLLAGFSRPFALAGGLTPETVKEAIRTLRPAIVDVSGGVETQGYKDARKIQAFVRQARTDGKEENT